MYECRTRKSRSAASLLSGRSIIHHGIFLPYGPGNDASGLNLSYTLLPQLLKQQHGYHTAMCGKWHLGMKSREYLPSSRGFDKFFGCAPSALALPMFYEPPTRVLHEPFAQPLQMSHQHACCAHLLCADYLGVMDYWKHYEDYNEPGNQPGLDLHEGGLGLGYSPGEDAPVYNSAGAYSTSLFAAKAAEWISIHGRTHASAPLFLYLAFQGVHSANNKFVQAPQQALDKFVHVASTSCGQYETVLTGGCTKRAMRRSAAAAVSVVDDAVGEVVTALKRAAMYQDTLLVLSSDNGGPTDGTDSNMMNNFRLRGCKGGYFEGGVRAVGLIHGAGLTRVRYVSKRLHHVSDWLPTLLQYAASQEVAIVKANGTQTAGGGLGDGQVGITQAETSVEPALDPLAWPLDVPWRLGDGVGNWRALSKDTPSARDEIIHAAQARGSVLHSHALRLGDLKLVFSPMSSDCSVSHAGWYPPPGLPWNYTTFSVACGGPPPSTGQEELLKECSPSAPCLFNISSDPCEYHNLAASHPQDVDRLHVRLSQYQATAVLPWSNFALLDSRSQPRLHGPTVPIEHDPFPHEGKHAYEGIWSPWLSEHEAARYYPSNYSHPSNSK